MLPPLEVHDRSLMNMLSMSVPALPVLLVLPVLKRVGWRMSGRNPCDVIRS